MLFQILELQLQKDQIELNLEIFFKPNNMFTRWR